MDDIREGAFGRVPDELGEALTAEEVMALPDGTPIVVIWSGGNGPGDYTLRFDVDGSPVAQVEAEARFGFFDHVGKSLDRTSGFVGAERFHTRVWRRAGHVDPGGE